MVGAGVVGCAVARELAGNDLRVALVEARADVGDGTSKANTAILHTGFDAVARLARVAARPARARAARRRTPRRSGIPVERTGAILVAWTEEEAALLPGLLAKARANGYERLQPARRGGGGGRRSPRSSPGALGGLARPR